MGERAKCREQKPTKQKEERSISIHCDQYKQVWPSSSTQYFSQDRTFWNFSRSQHLSGYGLLISHWITKLWNGVIISWGFQSPSIKVTISTHPIHAGKLQGPLDFYFWHRVVKRLKEWWMCFGAARSKSSVTIVTIVTILTIVRRKPSYNLQPVTYCLCNWLIAIIIYLHWQ